MTDEQGKNKKEKLLASGNQKLSSQGKQLHSIPKSFQTALKRAPNVFLTRRNFYFR
jgi:hypothetical protein